MFRARHESCRLSLSIAESANGKHVDCTTRDAERQKHRSHFLRQVNGRSHTTHTLLGRSLFLTPAGIPSNKNKSAVRNGAAFTHKIICPLTKLHKYSTLNQRRLPVPRAKTAKDRRALLLLPPRKANAEQQSNVGAH